MLFPYLVDNSRPFWPEPYHVMASETLSVASVFIASVTACLKALPSLITLGLVVSGDI